MPKLKSLEELQQLRTQLQKDIKARTETKHDHHRRAWARAASPPGAREVMQAVLDELDAREIDAHVTTVGCIGMCSREPLVDIQQGDEPRITYGNVTPTMVPRIIDEHLVNGQVVEEWVVARERGSAGVAEAKHG